MFQDPSDIERPGVRVARLPQLVVVVLLATTFAGLTIFPPDHISTGCLDVCLGLDSPWLGFIFGALAFSPWIGLVILELSSVSQARSRPGVAVAFTIGGAAASCFVPALTTSRNVHPYVVALGFAVPTAAFVTAAIALVSHRRAISELAGAAVISAMVCLALVLGQSNAGVALPPGVFDRICAFGVLGVIMISAILQIAALQRRVVSRAMLATMFLVWVLALASQWNLIEQVATRSGGDVVGTWVTRPWDSRAVCTTFTPEGYCEPDRTYP